MSKNKNLFFLVSIFLSIFISNFAFVNNVFASPVITSFLLNGSSQNVTFNPNNSESVSIEVKANTQVKFTRLYICSVDQICDGVRENYIRFFSQTTVSDAINKTWDGSLSSTDETPVPAGEYKIRVSMTEGTSDPVLEFGQYSIFVDFNSTTTPSNVCSSFTYSAWGTCSGGSQTRTVQTSIPSECTGGSPVLTQSCTTGTTSTNTNTPNTKVVTKIVYISTHSGEEDLSNYNKKGEFETTAGRERMALVGSPIEFNAKYILLQKDQCIPTFRWSFGDGFETVGTNIIHTYKYSGEYQVVLNGVCGEYSSISRTITKVITPDVSILSLINGDIEISNNGNTEINIGGWKITPTFKVGAPTEASEKQKDFIFPNDTIVSASKNITISKEDLNNSSSSEKISLNNPLDREVSYFYIKNTEQQNSTDFLRTGINQDNALSVGSNISVAEAEKLVKEYKEKLAINEKQINKTKNVEKVDTVEIINTDLPDSNDVIQTATVLDAVNSSSTKGFWSRLLDIPVKSIKSFAHVFYDF